MSEHPGIDERMAQAIDRLVRELPLRTAPAGLSSRVFSELTRLAARPWWRRSFAHWPAYARCGFVSACTVVIALLIMGRNLSGPGLPALPELAAPASWMHPFLVLQATGGLVNVLIRVIPAPWWYGGLGLGALLYVMLFGLGAAAYRTLYLPALGGGSP
jgi:hypothetical protein